MMENLHSMLTAVTTVSLIMCCCTHETNITTDIAPNTCSLSWEIIGPCIGIVCGVQLSIRTRCDDSASVGDIRIFSFSPSGYDGMSDSALLRHEQFSPACDVTFSHHMLLDVSATAMTKVTIDDRTHLHQFTCWDAL